MYNFFKLATESMLLCFEAQQVVGLRLMKISAGGAAAHTEAIRMMTEKMVAGTEALGAVASGGSGQRIVRRYRSRVKANKRRLTRKPGG
jgi:hypothetical protein